MYVYVKVIHIYTNLSSVNLIVLLLEWYSGYSETRKAVKVHNHHVRVPSHIMNRIEFNLCI